MMSEKPKESRIGFRQCGELIQQKEKGFFEGDSDEDFKNLIQLSSETRGKNIPISGVLFVCRVQRAFTVKEALSGEESCLYELRVV
ncbi:hypothetical protein F0562_016948 [Nyssa sinensis]|uniref:Uncharacterized protein n=1 Tax=Nyssa sinensis TaxID=561372 RepID=A0A5J4ZFP3_9ASTE|nr:hypothetical protein F0562_016948 [Nyssa sinensis]